MKYFTKTDFRRSLKCPTSVFYHNSEDQYINTELNDEFIKSLMEGGFQVEYLAREYFPNGINLKQHSIEDNLNITRNLLRTQENVTLFEACFEFNGFLIRLDVLDKIGDVYHFYEIKAKSFDFSIPKEGIFINSRTGNTLKADWFDYVLDVVFQKYVLQNAIKVNDDKINSYLYLLDKNKKCTVNGLHQKYLIRKDKSIEIKNISIGEPIMSAVQLDDIISKCDIYGNSNAIFFDNSFEVFITLMRDNLRDGIRVNTVINSQCKNCTFFSLTDEPDARSGFLECWHKQTKISKFLLSKKPTILDIWNYRGKDKLIEKNIFLIKDINLVDLFWSSKFNKKTNETIIQKPEIVKDGLLTNIGRQIIQIKSVQDKSKRIKVLKKPLRAAMKSFKYPLNMIDFETSSVAIPFSIHIKPYESIAFQFSHHIIHEDGRIEHYSEYLNTEQGKFPSFDFVRALKQSLESNNGTIFMFSPHENSILNHILRELHTPLGDNVVDKHELIEFIKTITVCNERSVLDIMNCEPWWGDRALVDMWDLLKKTYYNPLTNGSNSIKYVLPAILNSSKYLKRKYSRNVYGTDKIKSHNFTNHKWISREKKQVINPYKKLPILFEGAELINSESIANGGDAMVAYAKMQFTQISDDEKNNIIKSLLMYCELDTFAMVMLWEHWFYDIFNGEL